MPWDKSLDAILNNQKCPAGPTVADKVFNFDNEENGFSEQIINQPKPDHYKVPPTTNNIPSAPPMAATVDILPASHNTVVTSITCNEPTITHTSAPILSFNPPSSYTIAPTTLDSVPLLYYHPSSCTIPTTEIETFYEPSFINPFIETYPLASHNTPTNTQLCMATHNAPTLLNSQPPPPSGLPITPIYLTNQLNQVISTPPSYTTYSLDPIVSQTSTMNSPSSLGMGPSTFNPRPLFDTTSAFGGLHYNDDANVGFGFFTDAGMTVRQSEAMEPCNLGMYSSAPMQTFYDPENLQVLRDSNQPMVGCSTSMAPLQVAAKDESKIDESDFKVPKLTLAEKNNKINRYKEKKKARNYNRKINYPCRKILADSRHRVRGRFAKNDEVPQAASRPPTSVDH
ncbi:uncharacterized protein LOC110020382 [Phalaenopsis equestris]|uniref:uncharacterized protein LOC110020382 n=1 Tax=Phalaenopsis equestris TaxID=78828 RepID=UPI0009E53022|nr:uncharacterized protein LOC110020382 [Phalaenopsis equestris]